MSTSGGPLLPPVLILRQVVQQHIVLAVVCVPGGPHPSLLEAYVFLDLPFPPAAEPNIGVGPTA